MVYFGAHSIFSPANLSVILPQTWSFRVKSSSNIINVPPLLINSPVLPHFPNNQSITDWRKHGDWTEAAELCKCVTPISTLQHVALRNSGKSEKVLLGCFSLCSTTLKVFLTFGFGFCWQCQILFSAQKKPSLPVFTPRCDMWRGWHENCSESDAL